MRMSTPSTISFLRGLLSASCAVGAKVGEDAIGLQCRGRVLASRLLRAVTPSKKRWFRCSDRPTRAASEIVGCCLWRHIGRRACPHVFPHLPRHDRRPQVGERVEPRAQAQQAALRPLRRRQGVPLVAAARGRGARGRRASGGGGCRCRLLTACASGGSCGWVPAVPAAVLHLCRP
jgi:hypothetical protein